MKNNYLLCLVFLLSLFSLPVRGWAQTATLDISNGTITFQNGQYVQGSNSGSASGEIIITQSNAETPTANKILVKGETYHITLNGVNIETNDTDGTCSAFDMERNKVSNVYLTLQGNNRLVAGSGRGNPGYNRAGLSVSSTSSLTITEQSTGYLYVEGGHFFDSMTHIYGCGIGGQTEEVSNFWNTAAGKIYIKGGRIEAVGKDSAPDIGGTSKDGDLLGSDAKPKGEMKISGGIVCTINGNLDKDAQKEDCLVFIRNQGTVYGNCVLTQDYTNGNNITIPNGATLTIGSGVTLTNNGTITIEEGGTLQNNGTLQSNGIITGNGSFEGIKLSAMLTLMGSSGETIFGGPTLSFAYDYKGDGEVSVESANESIATVTVDVDQKKVTINPVGAGSTTIKVSAVAGKLYAATEQTYTVTVNKVKSAISFKDLPSDGYSKTYKEAEVKVEATKEGSTKDITYKYYTDEACTKGETVTQPTNVGTYWVKAMVEEDANYEAASAKAKFTVNKAILVADMFSFTAPENLTYDKSEKTAKVEVKADGTLQGTIGDIALHYYAEDGNLVDKVINVGNYKVKISVAESGNYKEATDITDENWTFNIVKTQVPEQGTWNTQSPYIAGEEIELTAPVILGIENEEVVYETVSIRYGNPGQATCPAEPGTYEVTATYQNNKNYKDTKVTTTIKVVAAEEVKATLPAVVESNGWYRLADGGDYPVELAAPEGYVFVTDGVASDTYPIPEDGTYTYSLKRNVEELESVASHTLSFDNTAPVIPSVPDANSVTTTSATFTLTDALSGITSYVVSENGKDIYSYPASQRTGKLTYTYNSGLPGTTHKLTFKVSDVAGNEAVAEVEFTINKATLTAEMFSFTAPENLTYDKSEKTAKVEVKADGTLQGTIGDIALHYYAEDGNLVDKVINVGNYKVKISVAESGNYKEATDITDENWTFNIVKTQVPEQGTWNTQSPYIAGEEIELTAPVILGIENEEVVYETVSIRYGNPGQATCPAEPGTYEVTATYQNNKNYKDTKVTTTIKVVAAEEVKATLPAVVESNGWYRLADGGDYPVELAAPEGYVFVTDGVASDTYPIPEDGTYTYSLKRNVEELESVASHTLSFDNTAPVIPSVPDANSVTTTSATFTLTDALSGITSYVVSENGKDIYSYPASQRTDKLTYTYSGSPGTTYKLLFKVTDVAGNEATAEVKFTLKSIPYVPVPSYYDLYFEANDSVLLSAEKTTVIEGSSFTVTAEAVEGYEPETLVVEYKKGRSGSWRTIEPNSNGKYRITNVYNDIYVRASVQRLDDPTAIDRVGGDAASIRAIGRTICITAGKPVDMRIIGIGGRVVRAEQLSAGYNEISGLQPGVYVVVLSDGTRSKVMVR